MIRRDPAACCQYNCHFTQYNTQEPGGHMREEYRQPLLPRHLTHQLIMCYMMRCNGVERPRHGGISKGFVINAAKVGYMDPREILFSGCKPYYQSGPGRCCHPVQG